MKKHFFAIATLLTTAAASAQIPLDYYSSLQGLTGAALKTAAYKIVATDPLVSMLNYGSGWNKTWWGFYVTDRNEEDNTVIDRYSYDTFTYGERGASVSGMNIEHSFPKSWWGGAENNAYKDLYNLMPCEASINQSKSNWPMGKVVSVTTQAGDNGCTKVGYGADSKKYWEPADQWKGDFARGYMYMATAYQDFTWDTAKPGIQILEQGTYPTLKPDFAAMCIDWAKNDPVSEIETVRTNRVERLQGNRNPYVDFPNLMHYVWGDSVGKPFDVLTTVKSAPVYGMLVMPGESTETVYNNTFLGDTGGCTIDNIQLPAVNNFKVWTNTADYGWKATASRGSSSNLTYYAAKSDLVTPEIDLTKYANISMSFDHACKFAAVPGDVLGVYVRESNGNETKIEGIHWPAGTAWTFNSSGRIRLSQFSGKKIRIVFRYTSTTEEACTWEVKNLAVEASGDITHTSISLTAYPDDRSLEQPVTYYTPDGRIVNPATYKGIAIIRRGNIATKTLIK